MFARIIAVVVALALSFCAAARADVRMALVSDPHCSPDPKIAEYGINFDRVIAQVNEANVDVVLISGDVTQTLSKESAELFLEKIKGFKAPVHYVGGNHDHGQRADKDKPATVNDARVEKYETLLGPSFYARQVVPGVRVIGIGGALFGSGTARETEQWAFLENELAKPKAGSTFILSHFPPFNKKPDEADEYFNIPTKDRERLLPLLKKGGVTAWLSGHLHYPLELKWEGLPIIGAPAVSFGLPRNVTREGWKLVTLKEDGTISTELKVIPRNGPASQPVTEGAATKAVAASKGAVEKIAGKTVQADRLQSLQALGAIAILPKPDAENAALKFLQQRVPGQLHVLTPDELIDPKRFNPQLYKTVIYLSGEQYVRTAKQEGDVDQALLNYTNAGGLLVVMADGPYPFYQDDKGVEAMSGSRFGLALMGNEEEDEAGKGFDVPPAGFELLFVVRDGFGGEAFPSRIAFPAQGERRWRPLVGPAGAAAENYEPWISLSDSRSSRKYGDAAAYVRKTSAGGKASRLVFVSHILTQNVPERDAVLATVFDKIATKVSAESSAAVSERAHIFYYNWYGAPPMQSEYVHWPQGGHVPPGDVGSNFYPKLGAYSSTDPAVLKQHMAWIRQARVGVVTLTWWGRNSYEEKGTLAVLDAAAQAGLKVNFHLEPYGGSTPESFADDVGYLIRKYGRHPAFYRYNGKAMFYLFETMRHPVGAWRTALDRLKFYGTSPVMMIAQTSDLKFVEDGGFDGGYTYDGLAPFRVKGFVEGWVETARRFKTAGKLFIPSVGPGYWDDRAVPKGAEEPEAAKTRDGGTASTYDAGWQAAIAAHSPIVTITSFNEWHEGSQIEPAVAREIPGYQFPAYKGGELEYLDRTARWVEKLLQ